MLLDGRSTTGRMNSTEELRRELGFWDALTIGVGTMIGAGIFLLAGVALELTGPAAIFAYVAAGAVCVVTAASAAELATGMPTSGGAYYFVSRAFGPALGAIAGVGTWLSLTVAISFYLFGLGEYLAYFVPLPAVWGAVVGGVLLTGLNVWGAKESGRTQVAIVLTLVGILSVFVIGSLFRLEGGHFTPFFPFGGAPIAGTTALVFVSFLGFVKIAAVAEEIRDPARNLPRALIGSVAVVTLLYVIILLSIGGIFPQERIGEVQDPLTAAARVIFGPVGAGAIIFAGLLATASSANASIMASSRINLAMARDRLVPGWLAAVHQKLMTPHRAIAVTGGLAVVFLAVQSIQELAKIASSLQLLIYAALNVACVALRGARPRWYRPDYRVPGYPYTPLAAAAGCLAIILYSGVNAQLAVLVLVVASLAWYWAWGRSRVDMEHGVRLLRRNWARLGLRAFFLPPLGGREEAAYPELPPKREIEPVRPRRVIVALGAPEHEADLMQLGRYIATGQDEGGEVIGLHFQPIPLHTTIEAAREQGPETDFIEATLTAEAERRVRERAPTDGPISETGLSVVTDYAHDVGDALVEETASRRGDLLLAGWRGKLDLRRIGQHPLQEVMARVRADLAVFKDRGLVDLGSIVLPWGGGIHARLGLEIALRVARCTGAEIELLRVVDPTADAGFEEATQMDMVETIAGSVPDVRVRIRQGRDVADEIRAEVAEREYDLVVIGASRESRLRRVLFGSIPDEVAAGVDCSVLMIRRYMPDHWTIRASEAAKRLRERAGLTTSPD